MEQYQQLLRHLMHKGVTKTDRTGTGTKSVFGYQMRFDLSEGFPLVTTKKVSMKPIIHELLWFLRGDTNIKYLVDNGVNIWNEWPCQAYLKKHGIPIPDRRTETGRLEWNDLLKDFVDLIGADADFARENGNLGPVYGAQWRRWPKLVHIPAHDEGTEWVPDFHKIEYIDQILEAVRLVKFNPDSRRIVVSAWNVADIEEMAKSGIPPCHAFFQFYVAGGKLSCQLYQRSCDTFLGVPFNIASYALLTMMVAQVCDLEPGEFVWTGGDVHIYLNHMEQVREQLSREPRPLPTMKIDPTVKDIFDFKYEDFDLIGYDPHPAIKAPVAV